VFSREQLLDSVWGRDIYIDERTVDVHIGRLRKLLNPGREQDPIRTVRGAGNALERPLCESGGVTGRDKPTKTRGSVGHVELVGAFLASAMRCARSYRSGRTSNLARRQAVHDQDTALLNKKSGRLARFNVKLRPTLDADKISLLSAVDNETFVS